MRCDFMFVHYCLESVHRHVREFAGALALSTASCLCVQSEEAKMCIGTSSLRRSTLLTDADDDQLVTTETVVDGLFESQPWKYQRSV